MKKILILLLFFFNLYSQFYAQCGQDKYLYETFFYSQSKGFFVEIGASDGIEYSNTYFFEKSLNWQGICIEPHPNKFASLVKNRPRSKCLNTCIAAEEKLVDFLVILGYSSNLSGILYNYDTRHLKRIEEELKKFGGAREIIQIKTSLLNTILKGYNVTKVDLLSIDVEGAEEEIIKSIDFDQFDISVILIENNYNQDVVRTFLESKKYTLIKKIDSDEVFCKCSLLF